MYFRLMSITTVLFWYNNIIFRYVGIVKQNNNRWQPQWKLPMLRVGRVRHVCTKELVLLRFMRQVGNVAAMGIISLQPRLGSKRYSLVAENSSIPTSTTSLKYGTCRIFSVVTDLKSRLESCHGSTMELLRVFSTSSHPDIYGRLDMPVQKTPCGRYQGLNCLFFQRDNA